MKLKLLAVGDMHLGRRPSRLPKEIANEGRRYGPAEAWNRTVDRAIEEGIDIVALAGDLVEKDDDYFEAYRDLREGIERLSDEGITVVGVTGNHDVLVLPRLAEELDDFRLLGADGEWEAVPFGSGDERLTLHGWSFPRKQVTTSPLQGHAFKRGEGVNLGLLHCDRDQRDSRYAPVSSDELQAAGLDGWLLGHIHRPDELSAPNPSGYLGSLSGLHPGEHGPRGPWLVEIEHGDIVQVKQWPLAPIEWRRIELDVSGIEEAEDARGRLLHRMRDIEEELQSRRRPPRALGLRVFLVGRTNLAGAAAERLSPEDDKDNNVATSHELQAFVERIVVATRPEVDLETIVENEHGKYPALVAQRLLILERSVDDEQRKQLIEGARRRLEPTIDQSRWAGLERPELNDEWIADWLTDTGTRMLEELLNQKRVEVQQ